MTFKPTTITYENYRDNSLTAKTGGFTLVELLIVIILIAVLTGAATLQFRSWVEIRNIEKQTREIQSDFLNQRLNAIYLKERRQAVINANQIQFNKYTSVEATPTAVLTRKDRYAIGRRTTALTLPITITYNQQGQVETTSTTPYKETLVILPQGSTTPRVNTGDNCIIVSDTLTKVGRMENVSTCIPR